MVKAILINVLTGDRGLLLSVIHPEFQLATPAWLQTHDGGEPQPTLRSSLSDGTTGTGAE